MSDFLFKSEGTFAGPEDEIQISILASSMYFSLDFVFVMAFENCFSLVVIHRNRLLTFKRYRTLQGAGIAFARMYRYKAWTKKIKNYWTIFYNPALEWLDERRRVIKKNCL